METFKSLVRAIEENNKINGAKWTDWESSDHVEEIYGCLSEKDQYTPVSRAFLDALIRDNGENLEVYLDAMECLQYGQAFSR